VNKSLLSKKSTSTAGS